MNAPAHPLQPGESYEIVCKTTLPQGAPGDYYLYIHLDAHNDFPPPIQIFLSRQLLKDWWPADSGYNDDWLSEFSRWVFEDPNNNLSTTPFNITYREPDLQVTDLQIPAAATAGEVIPVTYTVTNTGTRDTRKIGWTDRIFLSRDA